MDPFDQKTPIIFCSYIKSHIYGNKVEIGKFLYETLQVFLKIMALVLDLKHLYESTWQERRNFIN